MQKPACLPVRVRGLWYEHRNRNKKSQLLMQAKAVDREDFMKEDFMKEDFKCDKCGKPITGAYGSMGGNIVPYIPAKCYHMTCLPTLGPRKS